MKKGWAMLISLVILFSACGTKDVEKKTQSSETKPMQETVLYFVRHGKTMFNTTGQVQGWSDTPLTEEGVQGAKELAVGLKQTPFSLAYSSDLGRAIATANYILAEGDRKGLSVETLSGLREWNYGGYEGRDNAEMWTPIFEKNGLRFDEEWTQYGELTRKLSDEEIADEIAANDKTKTAENYAEIVERSKTAMDQILEEASNKGGGNILIVAHGSEIPTILEILVPGGYQGEEIKNCSVTKVKVAGDSFTIEKIGDLSYLEKGKAER
ncbi:histidine phosphatase family protein [Enterococcus termitis]|uniref:Phosphoglycerate mutase n=1 Tax=Enterococcus termitis TaxID=332950 RepID=A0A1E5GJL1_9ENTE|nr:histidine phosphatase family protein [Enterococcus termitis]OEG12882.1 phosphoglycerate mutase [Enterococcus termitis]OJG96604.1 phosphoglycerate mutase [Enterococcus termitis]